MTTKDIFFKRVAKMQEELKKKELDMVLFTDRENLIYYTGLTEIECMALIIPVEGDAVGITLWLDVNYIRENGAVKDIRGYVFPRENLGSKTVEVLKMFGNKKLRIGFGKYFVEFSLYEALRNGLVNAEFINATEISYKVRALKDHEELKLIKEASKIVAQGVDAAVKAVEPGMTEVQVLAEAEYAMRKAGSEGSSFRMQVLAGERQLLTHPYASENTIKSNQTVVIHLGATYKGYVSKMARTVALGTIPEETRKIYNVLVDAQHAGIKAVRPYVDVKEIFQATYKVVEEAGYGRFLIDDIGHGVGIRQSEFYPVIGRTRSFVLEENMVIDLIFPTIYKAKFGGARVTDTMVVSKEGAEILTKYSYDLIQK